MGLQQILGDYSMYHWGKESLRELFNWGRIWCDTTQYMQRKKHVAQKGMWQPMDAFHRFTTQWSTSNHIPVRCRKDIWSKCITFPFYHLNWLMTRIACQQSVCSVLPYTVMIAIAVASFFAYYLLWELRKMKYIESFTKKNIIKWCYRACITI